MGVEMSVNNDNDGLVDELKEKGYIKTDGLELLFRAVDRGFYFLPEHADRAYMDFAWRMGDYHISAPCIYGTVMENLNLRPGLSFLNIGSGTGYLSTMVGLLLGPYGVNHGVEIHGDLIDYANRKLQEFWRTSPAVDAYEFCEPTFVQGNCLCLLENCRQYDRVYCGAACPEDHEGYMQNLIKVGGVLLMPINDRLLRVTRTSETAWECVTLLPVSYATLKDPRNDKKQHVVLPELNPLTLQELCRSVVRTCLRKEAEYENPRISVHKKLRRSLKRKRGARGLIISSRDDIDEGILGLIVSRRFENTEQGTDQVDDSNESRTDEESFSEEECGRRKNIKIDTQEDEPIPVENNIVQTEKISSREHNFVKDEETESTVSRCSVLQNETATYSEIMREKIVSLPVPKIVKDFLNFHRPF